MNPPITADATLGALVESYPGLDEKLPDLVPAWRALRNPALRRAATRGATVAQAAALAAVAPSEMVRMLRTAAGVSADAVPEEWLMGARVVEKIDADAMLKSGVHPVGKVKSSVAGLAPGEAIQLDSSFRPQPLIDMMRAAGYSVATVEPAPGRHSTRFGRTP
jgi:hypothetical protein